VLASDYPFESAEESAHFIDTTPLADDVRRDICFNNAAKVFGLGKERRA
jgi:predicted TIM-barrel fold metal-dependent hydrolase